MAFRLIGVFEAAEGEQEEDVLSFVVAENKGFTEKVVFELDSKEQWVMKRRQSGILQCFSAYCKKRSKLGQFRKSMGGILGRWQRSIERVRYWENGEIDHLSGVLGGVGYWEKAEITWEWDTGRMQR